MLILLPPSETKTTRRRGRPTDPAALSFPNLTKTRSAVGMALGRASADPMAASLLGVSPSLTAEIERNAHLTTAPAVPVGELYSGVLYDALDLASLDTAARRRAGRRLVVISALYGALRPADRVAPYRLSMAVNLPGLGPVAAAWRGPLATVLPAAAGRGLVVDCRSSTYAAAWVPTGDLAKRWVRVRVPGATHMAKHTRGLVVRRLCESASDPHRPAALLPLLTGGFDASITAPTRPGQPWTLDVTALR